MTETLVEFEALTVRYGTRVALDRASGRFARGATGLLGPNGAGKTTLLKALLGFLSPSGGRIEAFGLSPSAKPLEVRRRIGYMPEVDAHLPDLTAVQTVAFAGELSGLPQSEGMRRAHEVLQFVGLGEERYRKVETYSTGMKQKVKLATALVHDPEIVLLDEPTNGPDPAGREEMLSLIGDIVTLRGLSVVLCSHLLRDVERVCVVRVKSDVDAFVAKVRERGGEAQPWPDAWRVALPQGATVAWIFETAIASGTQIRHLRKAEDSLEDIFLRATSPAA